MTKSAITVRIPQLAVSIEEAIQLYYSRPSLSNDDIKVLFGKLSGATISKLKKKAYEKMIEEDIPSWNATLVNTNAAYKAWGIDIEDLEFRHKKMKELSI